MPVPPALVVAGTALLFWIFPDVEAWVEMPLADARRTWGAQSFVALKGVRLRFHMHIAPNTAAAQTPSIGVVSIETGGRQREEGQYRQQREHTLSPSDPFACSCFKQPFFGKHRKKNSTLFFEPPRSRTGPQEHDALRCYDEILQRRRRRNHPNRYIIDIPFLVLMISSKITYLFVQIFRFWANCIILLLVIKYSSCRIDLILRLRG